MLDEKVAILTHLGRTSSNFDSFWMKKSHFLSLLHEKGCHFDKFGTKKSPFWFILDENVTILSHFGTPSPVLDIGEHLGGVFDQFQNGGHP